MKIFLSMAIVLLVAICQPASAQNTVQKNYPIRVTLSGKVNDEATRLPLHSCSIYIPDLKMGTTSDADGNYILKNLPGGNYVIDVAFVGYKNIVKNISLAE